MLIGQISAKSFKHPVSVLLLVLLCLSLFFWQLDAYSLFNHTEARQAEIARQIWVRNDWITPFYDGEIYFDKPILLHWLIRLGFPVFGLGEWAVRFPSALAATGLVLSTWLFTARFTTPRTAFLAATMLAANVATFTLGRVGQHDMLLVFFMTAGLYCWYVGYSTGRRWAYLAYFGLTALAVMSKGPLGVVLSGLALILFGVWVGRWQELLAEIPWKGGLFIFAGLTLPWYALVLLANGQEFAYNFFILNNVTRFVEVNQNQAGPWYYYIPIVLVGFFPWIALGPVKGLQLVWRSVHFNDWRRKSRQEHLPLFLLIWFLSVMLFMSVAATKLPWYVYPGFPALAILCAQQWEAQIITPDRWLKLNLFGISSVYLLTAIAFALVPQLISNEPVVDQIAQTGTIALWVLLYLGAAIVIGLSALRRKVLWAWSMGLVTFGVTALTLVNPVMPLLDQQVLGGRFLPIAIALHAETCATCAPTLPSSLGVSDPSINFYGQIDTIQRFEYPYELRLQLGQLADSQRLLLVTKDDALRRVGLDLSDYEPAYVAQDIKLYIFAADSDLALRTIHTPR
ncbi:ArnT family glycosyltransferase [Egbenema bharatensis]|uniref:ArnT family glycosyltransferase n=1 Tax=Egbenema bharatensis TaxID=3463334 RepID=UPI003A896737